MAAKFDGRLQGMLRQLTYTQPDLVRSDLNNMFFNFKDLAPMSDNYVFNNGTQRKLIKVHGTIPVQYHGSTYNIPIIIWIMENHPQSAPMCFVNPTNNMQIKAGKHVDSSGRIYLPYLSDWRSGSHDLSSLIQVMSIIFGEQTPVYAKQTQPSNPAQAAPRQPYAQPTRNPGSYPPAMPYPRTEGPPSSSYQPNLPYPPTQNFNTPYPPSNSFGPPLPYPGYPPQQVPSPYPHTPAVDNKTQSTISDEAIKASLLSAVNDKLKRRMKDAFAQAESEMTTLKQTENELKSGQEKLNNIITKLEEETVEVNKNISLLQERNSELEAKIEELRGQQDELNIDEVVTPTTPLYKQIVNSFAQEQAIEDTIYYLGEALRKGVLDLDVFLKHVRELSRAQFMLRAVIKSARETAGLVEI